MLLWWFIFIFIDGAVTLLLLIMLAEQRRLRHSGRGAELKKLKNEEQQLDAELAEIRKKLRHFKRQRLIIFPEDL